MSNARADLLVEIGTEELPPKALSSLMQSFATSIDSQLTDARLEHGEVVPYASPRRLAVLVRDVATAQPNREVEAKGPPVKVAFDDDGNAKPAATAFAKKCGVDVADLQRISTDKGEWLAFTATEKGQAAEALLIPMVEHALAQLPIPRRMRWGASDAEFVRPVHWVVLMLGDNVVDGEIMGHRCGNQTRGHRFMSDGEITITDPASYESLLEEKGSVVADFGKRRDQIILEVVSAAKNAGGTIRADEGLFDEVAALTEWPVAMTGHFDDEFLSLPQEAITASLTGHQRYFPIEDKSGDLMSAFVVVANLASKDPDKVRDGNERVIRPRLADAAFFWETDRKQSLADRVSALDKVVYQKGLGSLQEKSNRTAGLCEFLARELDVSEDYAVRAATLAKCDLITGMVGEFPELQGVMGRYYAAADGEPGEVAEAIGEQYLPRFAGDAVPASLAGQLLSLADKLDTLAGIFALGRKPSGNKDPFGLRRAALGVVRILIECNLEVGLRTAIEAAVKLQPVDGIDTDEVVDSLDEFIGSRLRGFYTERPEISAEIFDAVDNSRDRRTMPLPDFDQRIEAVRAFASMAEAESLAAANKRISNILQKADAPSQGDINTSLLTEQAEIQLYDALDKALGDVEPLQQGREYARVLTRLAQLREPVDRFFDEVMVMAEDENVKLNRLSLLSRLREPFHSVADISRLSAARN